MLTGFVEFPVFAAFYLWSACDIANVFRRLAENRCFADEGRYVEFTRRAHAEFSQSRWWVYGVAFSAAIVLLVHLDLWGPNAQVKPWFDDGPAQRPLLLPRVVSLGLVGVAAYLGSQIAIREALAIIGWRRLWRELGKDLVLHPYHPDEAAGLGAIGRHAVGISYCLLAMTLFVFMGSLLPNLRFGGPKVVHAAVDTVSITAGGITGPPGGRLVVYSSSCDPNGRCQATFRPRRMALAEGTVLHAQIARLPSKAEALNTWVPIDTVQRAVFPLRISMHADSEAFEVRLESIRTPLHAGVPTLRVFGITFSLWTPLIAVEWIMLLALVALSLGFLLWPAHAAMERALDSQLDALSRDLDEHLAAANATLRTDSSKFSAAMDAIERTKKVRTMLLEDCETWPLSSNLRRRLGVSSAISIGSSLVNLLAAGGLNLLRQIG